ncbi:phage terminase small subunit P27 family [Methylobacterium nodulans]|uniref:Phage terminase, small subunit, P27 family n=1 Tax=Methylobacterium nodulans (strain LMG 21967 / CNCM I-2342 / ORS 2060) TaxID=460265 RepID=B8ILU7_METNO|nr:phage terminase small subunit P27 family [Methylobacterium nodulans]ACL62072.1 phage terminase, small subunit, P27 family [Methylobacterium nodulans ORS 2060]
MAGRKRTPDAIKQLAGTAQPCRMDPDALVAAEGRPEPPDWLSARAAAIFRDLAAITDRMRIASPDDIAMLAMLASRLEEIELCTVVIEDLGRVYQTVSNTGATMHRARPEVGMRNEAMRHAQSLLAEFGLSPAARSRVSATTPAEENPFKDL